MPNGRRDRRGGYRQDSRQRGQRRFDRDRTRPLTAESLLFGEEIEREPFYPTTNGMLHTSAGYLSEAHRGLTLTADEIEIEESKTARPGEVEIEFSRAGEVARVNDRVLAPGAPTFEDLADQSPTIRQEDRATTVRGQFPTVVVTALIIGDQALAFPRGEFDFVRGETGPVGPLQFMPHTEIRSEIGEEHFIIGKRQSEEVIVALHTDEPESRQENRILKTKERVLQGLRAELQELMTSPRANAEAIGKLNERIRYIQKQRPVVYMKEQPLPKAVEDSMQTVETELDGQTEKLQGYVHIDGRSKLITIGRPVRIDPQEQGIDITEIIDGSGLNRQIRSVKGNEASLAPQMRRMLRDLHRPERVQREDKVIVVNAPIPVKLNREKIRQALYPWYNL